MQRAATSSSRGRATSSTINRPRLPVDSLAYALLGAARICHGVRLGRTLREGLEAERALLAPLARTASTAQTSDPQAAIHDLAARTLRRRGRADALLALIGQRVPEPPLLRELLVVAIALLVDALAPTRPADASFEARLEGLPYSPFTLVDQAVHAAAAEPELARGKGFINAVLRTLLRRLKEDPAALQSHLYGDRAPDVTRYELPSWWVDRLREAYPLEWRAIVEESLGVPPLVVRVNRRKSSRDTYLQQLEHAGIAARAVGVDAVLFERAFPVSRIPGFREGLVSVQDEAAQRAAPLLDVADGMKVLDACAAPGGKTGALLERTDGLQLTALDRDAQRLRRVEENLSRLNRQATLVAADLSQPPAWWDGAGFDRILLDAPCSGSGVIRRHPDIKLLRRAADIAPLAEQQFTLLCRSWTLLKPGGRLLYATCSLFQAENAAVIERFLAAEPTAAENDLSSLTDLPWRRQTRGWQLLPGGPSGGDGFYYACLTRTQ
jgi:16S rRNA (cytosine967-C5)-methyltransferase